MLLELFEVRAAIDERAAPRAQCLAHAVALPRELDRLGHLVAVIGVASLEWDAFQFVCIDCIILLRRGPQQEAGHAIAARVVAKPAPERPGDVTALTTLWLVRE